MESKSGNAVSPYNLFVNRQVLVYSHTVLAENEKLHAKTPGLKSRATRLNSATFKSRTAWREGFEAESNYKMSADAQPASWHGVWGSYHERRGLDRAADTSLIFNISAQMGDEELKSKEQDHFFQRAGGNMGLHEKLS